MPVTDPIADLLTRIRNAQHARHGGCACPWSAHKEEICAVLKSAGYVSAVAVEGEGKDKMLVLQFNPERGRLTLRRISKPGRRIYMGRGELRPVLRGFGMAVLTTSRGVMTDREAREKGVGGEVLCTVS